MSRLIKVGEAANILGVTVQTLRRWEKTGELLPDKKTEGGTRYYAMERLLGKTVKKESNWYNKPI